MQIQRAGMIPMKPAAGGDQAKASSNDIRFSASAKLKTFDGNGIGTAYEGVVVIDGRRTPFGKQAGALKDFTETDMATSATQSLLKATGIKPEQITNSIWGNVIPSSDQAAYLSRDVLLRIGAPISTPAHNLNKLCGSGMFVANQAAKDLALADTSTNAIYLVGGAENMSSAPFGSFKVVNTLMEEGAKAKKDGPKLVQKYLPKIVRNWLSIRKGTTTPSKLIGEAETKLLRDKITKSFVQDLEAAMSGTKPTSDLQFVTLLREGLSHKGTKELPINHGMIDTAEKLRKRFLLTDKEIDEYSVTSQHRTGTAWASHKFDDEVAPVTDAEGKVVIAKDEHMRPTTKVENLEDLRKKQGSRSKIHTYPEDAVHTAANASGIVDGAVAMLMTNQETADRLGLKTLGQVKAVGEVGVNPKIMGLGAAKGGETAMKASGLKFSDIDLFEVNEAFASVGLSTEKRWAGFLADERFEGWLKGQEKAPSDAEQNKMKDKLYKEAVMDMRNRTNINGGSIAMGHPLGATGSRLILTMMKELKRQNLRYGLVSACIGGGQGIGVVVENPDAPAKGAK